MIRRENERTNACERTHYLTFYLTSYITSRPEVESKCVRDQIESGRPYSAHAQHQEIPGCLLREVLLPLQHVSQGRWRAGCRGEGGAFVHSCFFFFLFFFLYFFQVDVHAIVLLRIRTARFSFFLFSFSPRFFLLVLFPFLSLCRERRRVIVPWPARQSRDKIFTYGETKPPGGIKTPGEADTSRRFPFTPHTFIRRVAGCSVRGLARGAAPCVRRAAPRPLRDSAHAISFSRFSYVFFYPSGIATVLAALTRSSALFLGVPFG